MTGGPAQSQQLLDLATDEGAGWTFGQSLEGEPFAQPVQGPPVAVPLRGSRLGLRQQLAHRYTLDHGKPPTSSALADTMLALEGKCAAAVPRRLDLRVAADADRTVLDLGREDGQVIVVTSSGWRMAEHALPIVFRRTALTAPLPDPVRGGDLTRLRHLLNVADAAWPPLLAWLVLALRPDVAHPVLQLGGEQGAGKTTAGRIVGGLLDPSPVPLRSAPRTEADWPVAASGSWIVGLDNLSTVTRWLSDLLCRASTGDGYVKRALYTDGDITVLAFRRALILTAIDPGALAADLTDRLLKVDLAPISDRARRTDADLDAEWQAAHGPVLGGLLDLAVKVRRELDTLVVPDLPRMADYARTLAAVDRVLGTDGLRTYRGQRHLLAAEIVDSSPVAAALRDLAASAGSWEGTPTELLAKITPSDSTRLRHWPTTARGLTAELTRHAPGLRAVGVSVEHRRSGGVRRVVVATEADEQKDLGFNRHNRHDRHDDDLTSTDVPGRGAGPVTVVPVAATAGPATGTPLPVADQRERAAGAGCAGCDGSVPAPSPTPSAEPDSLVTRRLRARAAALADGATEDGKPTPRAYLEAVGL